MTILNGDTQKSITTPWESGNIISSNKLNEIYNAIISIVHYLEKPAGENVETELATKLDIADALRGAFSETATFGSDLNVTGNLNATNMTLSAGGTYKVGDTPLSITSTNLTIAVDSYPAFQINLPVASSSVLGGVQIGNNIVNTDGVISIPMASSSTPGVVQTGTNITNTAGVISIAYGTKDTIGVVKAGSNILSDGQGTISIPEASTSTAGVVKLLSGDNAAIISTSGGITVQQATSSQFGAVKIGTGINIDNGIISAPVSSTASFGIVKIGDNINVSEGTISVPLSTSSTTGLMTPEQYNKLAGIAAGAGVTVQSNWNETNAADAAYILNKPSLGTVASKNVDNSINSGSTSTQIPTTSAVVTFVEGHGFLTTHQDISNKLDIPNITGLTDGDYILKLTLTNGEPTYSWILDSNGGE